MTTLAFHPSLAEGDKQKVLAQFQANNNHLAMATGEVISLAEQRQRADEQKRRALFPLYSDFNNTPDDAA